MPEVRLIDANALQDKIRYTKLRVKSSVMMAGFVEMKAAALREIENAPTIDAEPVRHGRWRFEKGDNKTTCDGWICIACNYGFHTKVPYFEAFNFCPMCGARMDGGADNG